MISITFSTNDKVSTLKKRARLVQFSGLYTASGIVLLLALQELLKEYFLFDLVEPWVGKKYGIKGTELELWMEFLEQSMIVFLFLPIVYYFVFRPIKRFNSSLVALNNDLILRNQELEEEVRRRVLAEKRFNNSEERYRLLFQHSRDLIGIFSLQGQPLELNPAWKEAMGEVFQKDQVFLDIVHPQDRPLCQQMFSLLQAGTRMENQQIRLKLDRHILELEVTGIPLQTNDGKFVQLVVRDIGLRKQREQELLHAKLEAEQANLVKTQFLAMMSHEVRTPLNSIMGFSNLVYQNLQGKVEFKHLLYLENVLTSCQSLLEMINNIIEISQIESGIQEVLNEPVNLMVAVKNLYQLHKTAARDKKVDFNYTFDSRLPEYIRIDRGKLLQVVNYLLSSYIRNSEAGEAVTFALYSHEQGISIHFTGRVDTGSWFTDLDSGTSSKPRWFNSRFEGEGVSITYISEVIQLMNGTIQSVLGAEGMSTLVVKLPVEKTDTPLLQADSTEYNVSFSNQDFTILVVEDNQMNRELLNAYFERLGLQVCMAETGQGLMELLKTTQPDLIFLDRNLPDFDGLELTYMIRRHPGCEQVPVVIMSADALTSQISYALENGVSDYLTKPLKYEQLVELLLRYLQPVEQPEKAEPLISAEQTQGVKRRLREEFLVLRTIPLFITDGIMDQIQKIRRLTHGQDERSSTILKKIEHAAVVGDESSFYQLINDQLQRLSMVE